MRKTIEERFWSKVRKTKTCWHWTGCTNVTGYGLFWDGTRWPSGQPHLVSAHRWLLLQEGPPPFPTARALHHCDTPNCVRLTHLYWGTPAQNNADMMSRNRHNTLRGEEHGSSRLTQQQVDEMREKFADGGYRYVDLAPTYGITPEMVSLIIRRKRWS